MGEREEVMIEEIKKWQNWQGEEKFKEARKI